MWIVYVVTYLLFGSILQLSAPYTRIARFANDWQVVTLYGFYLIPLSVLLRGRAWHTQYAYALAAIAPIDIGGFALHTSLAYPDNFLDSVVGERNFTLTFVVLASWIPYCGNIFVEATTKHLQLWYRRNRHESQCSLSPAYDETGSTTTRFSLSMAKKLVHKS
jgi:hypothetical protein